MGKYSRKTIENARAFRLLIYAEIEHFFEAQASDIADAAWGVWCRKGRPPFPLVHLLCNGIGEMQGLPTKQKTSIDATTVAGKLLGQYRYRIQGNNGIKVPNILVHGR